MTKKLGKSVSGVVITMLAGTASSPGLASQPNADKHMMQVREVLGSFGKDKANLHRNFVQEGQYIEHDPTSPIGRLVLNVGEHVDSKAQVVTIIRAFSDGDFVVTQSEYSLADSFVIFDIFRFDGGHIVEHWANVQKRCAAANVSGRTQLDGPTQITDLDATDTNKASVNDYFRDVVFGARADLVSQYKNVADFRQHNCLASDLKNGAPVVKSSFTFKIQKLERTSGQGNFVLAVSTGVFNGSPTRFYDLYRLEAGKQVEHWDVLQEIK